MAEGALETSQFVEQSEKKQLKDELWDLLENARDRKDVDDQRRSRQKQVLADLPYDFEYQMKGAFMDENTPMFGELFEVLVRADTLISGEPETQLGATLRTILSTPKIHALEAFGLSRARNPDACKVNAKQEIEGVVEAKAKEKPIDFRAFTQLEFFEPNFVKLVDKLKTIGDDDLREHGLGVIVENKDKLKISDKFTITLVLPTGIYDGDPANLIDRTTILPKKIPRVLGILSRCDIKESPFSIEEIALMEQYVNRKYKEETKGSIKVTQKKETNKEQARSKYRLESKSSEREKSERFRLTLNKVALERHDEDGKAAKFIETWVMSPHLIQKVSFISDNERLLGISITKKDGDSITVPIHIFRSIFYGNAIEPSSWDDPKGVRFTNLEGKMKVIYPNTPETMGKRGEDWREIVRRMTINGVSLPEDVDIDMKKS